jgi:hypothetical protein
VTSERIHAIYEELKTLSMLIDLAPEMGPEYLLTSLADCRRRQERAVALLVEVRQARTAARRIHRALRERVTLVSGLEGQTLKVEADEARDLYDELTTVESCVNVVRSNLRMADSDIRLAERLVEQQRQLGSLKPPPSKLDEVVVPSSILGAVDLQPPSTAVSSTATANEVKAFLKNASTAAEPQVNSGAPAVSLSDLLKGV